MQVRIEGLPSDEPPSLTPTLPDPVTPDAEAPATPLDDIISPAALQEIEKLISKLSSLIDSPNKPHEDQHQPIDRPTLVTVVLLQLDWEESGFVTKD